MKKILPLILVLALVLCAPIASAEAAPTGEVVFWGLNSEAVGSGNAEMIAALEEMYPGLTINAQTTPGTTGYSTQDVTKLLAAIAAGNPPDAAVLDRFTAAQFAARGALQSLDDLIVKQGIDMAEYAPYTVDEVTFLDKIWAIPTGTDTRLLYWNKDVFAEAGLDPETPPDTWDQLLEMAAKLNIINNDGSIERLGFIPNYGNSWLYMYGFQNGATFLSEDGRTAMFDDPKLVEALEFMVRGYDLVPDGAKAINAFQGSFLGEGDDPFIQGQVAMVINGNWAMSGFARYAPTLNYGVCLAPTKTGNDKITWAGGWSYVIPAGAKNPEGAIAALQFFTQEGELIRCEVSKDFNFEQDPDTVYMPGLYAHLPTMLKAIDKYIVTLDNQDIAKNFQIGQDAMAVAKYRPVTPVGEILWTEHVKAAEKAFYHDMTPLEALTAGNAVVQEELDKFWADYDFNH